MLPQDAEQVPAFGSSNIVNVPSGARRKACRAELAARMNATMDPGLLIPLAKGPWPAAVPAPGASNGMMHIFFPPAFAVRLSPNVQRTTRHSAIRRRG